ncbi:MAG: hypothetical protein ACOWWO_11820 [Peptococcaceae bacterium]
MMKKRFLFLLVLTFLLSTGCGQGGIKDNQVYVVEREHAASDYGDKTIDELDTEGRIPFQEYRGLPAGDGDSWDQVLLTIAPDGKAMYFMEPMDLKETSSVIKGSSPEKVRLYRLEGDTGEERTLAENVPFVSRVQWNQSGTLVAFGGGERLLIYSPEADKLLLENQLQNDSVNYFFWSPKDESKLYSEQASLVNGAIYYVDSQKKVEAYETREELYFKGKLDNDYYYATRWSTAGEQESNTERSDGMKTVIIDKQGNTVKVLAEGCFRDAYKKSLLQVGEGGFGLYYTADIDRADEVKTLTAEYVYDVRFVADGKIAYIIADNDFSGNNFLLYITDQKGSQLKKLTVSGSNIALLPDGKTGYVGGQNWEKVDFESNEIINIIADSRDWTEEELAKEEIGQTLRGAVDILCKFELGGETDLAGAKKYFIDTYSPDQWAYFDLTSKFKESPEPRGVEKTYYRVKIELQDYQPDFSRDHASIALRAEAFTSGGGGITMDYALELKKDQDTWYVTGFSTFPDSPLQAEVLEKVKAYVQEIKEGKYFPGKLENAEITIGQIQFWRSSMPYLALNIENANLCKVYLKVREKGKETIYKMIMDKKNQNYWKPVQLTTENVGSFY